MGGVGRLSIIVQIANYNEQQKKMHKMRELCSFFSFSYFFSKLLFFQVVAWKMIYSLLNSGHFEPLLANITFPKTWKSYGCFSVLPILSTLYQIVMTNSILQQFHHGNFVLFFRRENCMKNERVMVFFSFTHFQHFPLFFQGFTPRD